MKESERLRTDEGGFKRPCPCGLSLLATEHPEGWCEAGQLANLREWVGDIDMSGPTPGAFILRPNGRVDRTRLGEDRDEEWRLP